MSKFRLIRKCLTLQYFDAALELAKEVKKRSEDDSPEVDEKSKNIGLRVAGIVAAVAAIPTTIKVAAVASTVAVTAAVIVPKVKQTELKIETTPVEKMDTYEMKIPEEIDVTGLKGTFNVSADTLSRYESRRELINEKFDKYSVPRSMSLITVIETNAGKYGKSVVGAMGPWQFMPATGREWGLRTEADFYDWEKSTDAAARYIKYLHKRMNNWYLAVMAYNCGPGNVNKALTKAGISTTKKSYTDEEVWAAWKYVPKETKAYLLRFLDVSGKVEIIEGEHTIRTSQYDLVAENTYNSK